MDKCIQLFRGEPGAEERIINILVLNLKNRKENILGKKKWGLSSAGLDGQSDPGINCV